MFKTIIQASENFCIHQIRVPHVINDGVNKKRTLIAYIDIDAQDGKNIEFILLAKRVLCKESQKYFWKKITAMRRL